MVPNLCECALNPAQKKEKKPWRRLRLRPIKDNRLSNFKTRSRRLHAVSRIKTRGGGGGGGYSTVSSSTFFPPLGAFS